jgi:hypothetical protein
MAARLVVVLLVGVVVAAGTMVYRRWRARLEAEAPEHPRLPADLVGGAGRTWVLFSTPWCSTCGPLEAHLRAAEPDSRVVRVDATVDQALAETYSVRSAPTVLLADGRGDVERRFVGPAAVTAYLRELQGV